STSSRTSTCSAINRPTPSATISGGGSKWTSTDIARSAHARATVLLRASDRTRVKELMGPRTLENTKNATKKTNKDLMGLRASSRLRDFVVAAGLVKAVDHEQQ